MPKVATYFLSFPRYLKRLIACTVDGCLCILATWLAFYLRTGDFSAFNQPLLVSALVSLAVALPVFSVFGLYRAVFRYSGGLALITVSKATASYGLIYAGLFTALGMSGVPRTVGLIQPLLLLLLVGGSRAAARFWLGGLYRRYAGVSGNSKVLIYGAGEAGRQLAAAMQGGHRMRVVGFLDDDHQLHGQVLNGLQVYNPSDLHELVHTQQVSDVLLAVPSISRQRRNEILQRMLQAKVSVRTLPSMTELAQGRVTVSDLRELDIDDLLGREHVVPDPGLFQKNIRAKVVLVTGAGGSIGSELCRQILRHGPRVLLLLEQSEFALYQIHQELQALELATEVQLIPLIASVQNPQRMQSVLQTWSPHTIYHAAAYKHVPMVEHNLAEGVRNNVFGTLVTARYAREAGCEDFVLISTDKAVRPTNVMGASKRLAEMVLQALADAPQEESNHADAQQRQRTRYSMVRFGNVLGSSGSVVPKFRQQIRDGGPITLTHAEMTRYFMTIPEAAQLVIQAGAMATGGDVFVLDMGEPVRIRDLALRMIELSGLSLKKTPDSEGDIEIVVTGLRPGEKLYEELLIGDNPQPTMHPRIMKAHEEYLAWSALKPALDALDQAMRDSDPLRARQQLQKLVTGFTPVSDLVDWVYLAQPSGQQ